MLSDYEALEDKNALSKLMSTALESDIKEARGVLGSAYEQMPRVLRQLDEIQQDFAPIETAIVELRKTAIAANKDKVMVQRFVSGALKLVGGVAKGLPIGQPFLGAAGGALGSIGEFDWNAAARFGPRRLREPWWQNHYFREGQAFGGRGSCHLRSRRGWRQQGEPTNDTQPESGR